MAETTPPAPPKIPKISLPVPSNATGSEFATTEDLLDSLNREASGLYLVGTKGMWHGGIHITDTSAPWCALTGNAAAERTYAPTPHKGLQHLRCMADGEIVAYRVCKEYPTIPWADGTLSLSGSFVLVRHYVQPGTTVASGLTFYTLYMHLAPFSAYASQTDPRQRKTKNQRYYLNMEDAEKGTQAGQFTADTVVTLGDEVKVRSTDKHQFSQVKMADGKVVWTACDADFLKTIDSTGASVPPWWSQCSPAYNVTPATAAVFKSNTTLSYYRTQEDVMAEVKGANNVTTLGISGGKLPPGTQVTMETDNAAQTVTRSDDRVFKLMTMTADIAGTTPPLKRGHRVWVVSDGGNLDAVSAPASAAPKFDDVVVATTPIAIKAGASVGHMGFFQIPNDTGSSSRYMVHIECLTIDDKITTFLTNPESAGHDSPTYLKYAADTKFFNKDAQGAMVDSTRKTKAPGILTLSKVPAEPASGTPTHYQIRPEGGYLAAASVEKLSSFDLGKLGFSIIKDDPASFQLLDGETQPQNVVKTILEKLHDAAADDPVFAHALASHKYKQLLNDIDKNHDGHYSVDEYRQAVQNPVYRTQLYQLIAKHPSEWYFEKTDTKWSTYLATLTTDAPEWKAYTEAFLDKMVWMKKVSGMGPEPWHMHPVMFMGALIPKSVCACNRDITVSELKNISSGITDTNAELYIQSINDSFRDYGITDCLIKAHMLAQMLHESARFGTTKEYHGERASYSPWYGRGLIQVSLEDNYNAYGQYVNEDVSSSDSNRDKLLTVPHSVKSAFWFFKIHTQCYEYAVLDDFNKTSHTINGGFIGYNDRLGLVNSAIKSFHAEHLLKLNVNGSYNFQQSKVYDSKRGALAWGLWHDPGTNKEGMTKDTTLAIEGYKRFKDILSSNPFTRSELGRSWYQIRVSELEVYVNGRIEQLEAHQ